MSSWASEESTGGKGKRGEQPQNTHHELWQMPPRPFSLSGIVVCKLKLHGAVIESCFANFKTHSRACHVMGDPSQAGCEAGAQDVSCDFRIPSKHLSALCKEGR